LSRFSASERGIISSLDPAGAELAASGTAFSAETLRFSPDMLKAKDHPWLKSSI
jgi:hypothetical protein